MAIKSTGIASVEESKMMVCADPAWSIVGTKRIPDLEKLGEMSASELASL